MVIEPTTLLAYAILWTVFYFFLSEHIAQRSRKTWTAWIQSEQSDEILVEALTAVIEEIRVVYILLSIIQIIESIMIWIRFDNVLYIHIYYIEYAILEIW